MQEVHSFILILTFKAVTAATAREAVETRSRCGDVFFATWCQPSLGGGRTVTLHAAPSSEKDTLAPRSPVANVSLSVKISSWAGWVYWK